MIVPDPRYHVRVRRLGVSKKGQAIWLLPDTANAIRNRHYMAQHRDTRLWHELVVGALLEADPALRPRVDPRVWEKRPSKSVPVGRAPALWPQATALFVRHSTAEPDYDGLVRSCKGLQDALVLAGIVEDDKPRFLRGRYWWQKAKRADQRVEIMIWPGFVDVPSDHPGEGT